MSPSGIQTQPVGNANGCPLEISPTSVAGVPLRSSPRRPLTARLRTKSFSRFVPPAAPTSTSKHSTNLSTVNPQSPSTLSTTGGTLDTRRVLAGASPPAPRRTAPFPRAGASPSATLFPRAAPFAAVFFAAPPITPPPEAPSPTRRAIDPGSWRLQRRPRGIRAATYPRRQDHHQRPWDS